MRRGFASLLAAALAFGALSTIGAMPAAADDHAVPRTILAIHNLGAGDEISESLIHRLVEMPLNQLGLKLRYQHVDDPLPSAEALATYRGVLVLLQGDRIADPAAYVEWTERAVDAGLRLVIMGQALTANDGDGRGVDRRLAAGLLTRLGLEYGSGYTRLTYDWRLIAPDPAMVTFERALPEKLPPFERLGRIGADTTALLVARRNDDPATDSVLAALSPRGGYVALEYAYDFNPTSRQTQWFIDPFAFFRRAFATDDLPKPDVTTLAGRRIYYSHVDGDGWRNRTQIERYRDAGPTYSAQVLLDEIIAPYPDLPVTVAPVTADLDPNWYGNAETIEIAREIFALRNVEIGTHSYSHPLYWKFFEDGDTAKEAPYLALYPRRESAEAPQILRYFGLPRDRSAEQLNPEAWYTSRTDAPAPSSSPLSTATAATAAAASAADARIVGYRTPRAFAVQPFDIELEIQGSIDFLEAIAPPGKRVKLAQWSGDTRPWAGAIAKSREAGLVNINGGDTRFDREFPSYAWVAPIGLTIGDQQQIYASTSNENTYTELWTDRFFGFRLLLATLQNTERPMRVKPLNVYYHVYTMEKQASLAALKDVLAYVRTQPLAPITASHYARIADGFYTTRLIPMGGARWRIEDRGALETIRFDRATFRRVDFARSEGVIGQRHYQGSLYVALDANNRSPIVALADNPDSDRDPPGVRPYLIESRWRVSDVTWFDDGGFSFAADGFGAGAMSWWVRRPGSYEITVEKTGSAPLVLSATAGADGRLAFSIAADAITPLAIRVRPL